MAFPIMVQGTMSNVGKSIITAGLCRIFLQDGYSVAPFKSQNMALNSFITKENAEIGRAQAVQAEACRTEPSVCMNPILLKPVSDMGSQVIIMGKAIGNMNSEEYYRRKNEFIPVIKKAYDKLSGMYDIIVIEGAGSPAEINLKENDIVNMGMAKIADSPVLLVGDIDKGGVFAQLKGTVDLLDAEEKDRVKGLIINKFRGDKKILEPGLEMLEKLCGKKVLGVVDYMDTGIDEEDSLYSGFTQSSIIKEGIDIAVIKLPRISNFTDFRVFEADPFISLRYVRNVHELKSPDVVIIPGTKNTISDLVWLRESGLEAAVKKLCSKGTITAGICGGFQMLGEKISDPSNTEGGGEIQGMGLLPVATEIKKDKVTQPVNAVTEKLNGIFAPLSSANITGYEIHNGRTVCSDNELIQPLTKDNSGFVYKNIIGTYIHGIFDNESFRKAFTDMLCDMKGIKHNADSFVSYSDYKNEQYDKIADVLRKSLDMEKIYDILFKRA